MVDVVSKDVRSRMMSRIRSKNTKPELLVRSGLHRLGYRYRLHDPLLPGKPDLVFRGRKAALFVNGCFWHGHDCSLFKWPTTRPDFWEKKIGRNRERDHTVTQKLIERCWRVGVVWECSLKGARRRTVDEVIGKCVDWLASNQILMQVRELGDANYDPSC